jgi:PAS domain S-box-containing protein
MDLQAKLGAALLQMMSDAIIASDRDGKITFWNPGAERIFGFSRTEAIGQSLDLIIPERLRARHWAGYIEMMHTGESRYGHGDLLSVPALRKDGTRLSIEFTILPLKDEAGAMTGMAAILRDVTARFEEMRRYGRRQADRLISAREERAFRRENAKGSPRAARGSISLRVLSNPCRPCRPYRRPAYRPRRLLSSALRRSSPPS